jgi:adenosylhomocysteine nucleosidase
MECRLAPPARPSKILVVTGLAREARFAEGPGMATFCSGGAPERLRLQLRNADPADFSAVISFGLAGGLDPALEPGDVVVATQTTSGAETWLSHEALVEALALLAERAGRDVVRGPMAGAEAVVLDAAEKAVMRAATGAIAVDMESHVGAAFAAAHDLPFAALRVISDPAVRALPPLAMNALNADGRTNLAAVFTRLVGNPGQLAALIRAGRDANRAFAALTRLSLGSWPLIPPPPDGFPTVSAVPAPKKCTEPAADDRAKSPEPAGPMSAPRAAPPATPAADS